MKAMIVKKHSVFPAAKEEVFSRLHQLETLRYIARPYATFAPVNGKDNLIWHEGECILCSSAKEIANDPFIEKMNFPMDNGEIAGFLLTSKPRFSIILVNDSLLRLRRKNYGYNKGKDFNNSFEVICKGRL